MTRWWIASILDRTAARKTNRKVFPACLEWRVMTAIEDIPKLRFAVVGAGAVGGFYGGMLASHGRDVHFLMRSDLAAVKENGLTIHSPLGEFHLSKAQAYARTEEIGPCDVVLVAAKATANAALPELIAPLMQEGTCLVTLQNGLGNEEFLASHFGRERVLGGLCFVCLNRTAPGVVEHYDHGSLSIGEFRDSPKPRTHRIVSEFKDCGINARAVEDLVAERWRKLVWNIPFNGLSIAAGRLTVGDILADEGLVRLTRELMREVAAAAGRLGHAIPEAFVEEQITRSSTMGSYKPSSLLDTLAGREVEVEAIWGEPYRRAVAAGSEAPRLGMLYTLLKKLTIRPD
jgi:2-dehydropantoate 2-reductase